MLPSIVVLGTQYQEKIFRIIIKTTTQKVVAISSLDVACMTLNTLKLEFFSYSLNSL